LVTVGAEQNGPMVVPGSFVPVTFNHGYRAVTIPAHGRVTSDPVGLTVSADEKISVSIAVAGWATVSVHYCCTGNIDSWATKNGAGDHTTDPTGQSFNPLLTGSFIRWLSGVSVANSPAQGSVVAVGDSITDGYGYENTGFSWVNALQQRISKLPPSDQMSVINEGIAGNTLTVFPPRTSFEGTSGGLPGVTRLATDALAWPGVKAVVVLLGTNDIWFGAGGVSGKPIPPYGTAASIEAGLRSVAAQVRARGLPVYAITLLPRATSIAQDHDLPEYWGPSEQAILSAVNAWLLSARTGFTGVINLAAVMGNVYNGGCNPNTPFAPYFNPDHLHPNVAGATIMANAISTQLFGLPSAPLDRPVLSTVPTPGCTPARTAAAILAAAEPTTTTTTSPRTTTTTERATTVTTGSLLGSVRSLAIAVFLGLVAVVLAFVTRRRVMRRRQRRRQSKRIAAYPRVPPPASPRGMSSPTPRHPRR
jgi:lysophospholipase L1-like esterase